MIPKKVTFGILTPSKSITLTTPQVVTAPASYSPILTLSSYILYNHPKISPLTYKGQPSDSKHIDKIYPCPTLSCNDYFEPWCDYLSQLLQAGKCYLCDKDDTLYFVQEVENQDWVQGFLQNKQVWLVKELNEDEKDCNIFKRVFGINQKKPEIVQKIGIANFASSQLRTDPFRPKVNLGGLIQGIWFGNYEWKLYNILKAQFPSEQEFKNMDVLVLTGSSHSINDCVPQVEKFIDLVRNAVDKHKNLKIVGLCFGHQFLCKTFGGQVVKRPKVAGIQKIRFNQQLFQKHNFLQPIKNFPLKYLALSQYHSDYVNEQKMPKNFITLASSDTCPIQGMISQDRRMISFQFHAQYTTEYTKSYEHRVSHYKVDDVLDDFCGDGKSSDQHAASVQCMRLVIMKFINP